MMIMLILMIVDSHDGEINSILLYWEKWCLGGWLRHWEGVWTHPGKSEKNNQKQNFFFREKQKRNDKKENFPPLKRKKWEKWEKKEKKFSWQEVPPLNILLHTSSWRPITDPDLTRSGDNLRGNLENAKKIGKSKNSKWQS